MNEINKILLSKQTKFRLNEIIGIENYSHQEIKQRKSYSTNIKWICYYFWLHRQSFNCFKRNKWWSRVAKNAFLRGSAKIELAISCEDFYTNFMLNHHSKAHPAASPPTPNTYSYLPFENCKFMVVRKCNKEHQSQIFNFISKNRLITYC